MKIAFLAFTAFFLMMLMSIFFISRRWFFALSIPARAFANLTLATPAVSMWSLPLSFADLLAMVTILFAVIHLSSWFRQVMVNLCVGLAMVFLVMYVFVVTMGAVSSPISSGKPVEAAKVISWLIYLPVGLSLFGDDASVALLKRCGILGAVITVFGVILGQTLDIGDTAYDLGMVHLGFYTSEAALTSSLAGCLLFFFLPNSPDRRLPAVRRWGGWAMVMMLLVLVVLIMVRSIVLGVFLYLILFVMTKRTAGWFKTMGVLVIVIFIFTGIVGVVLYTNPRYVEERFKDVKKYQAGGKPTSLGSGRLSLIHKYLDEFGALSLPAQLFGLDSSAYTIQDNRARLAPYRTVQFGTHNDALQILFMAGVVGLICYTLMWIFLACALWLKLKRLTVTYYRQLAAVGVGAGGMYALLVFHGAIFHVFLMQSIAIILGAVLAGIHLQPIEHKVN